MSKRVFLVVCDSFGVGETPDAKKYGDEGSNTLKAVSSSINLKVPTLTKLGLFNIDGTGFLPKAENPIGVYGKLSELSTGKDSTSGHWEISGLITKNIFPTFSNGFPRALIKKLEKAWGTKILCNKPYSGTQVIIDYGAEHLKTGYPIVYTSADSVLQIACHESIYPREKLYELCKIARTICKGKYAVGRIIARPFIGEVGEFTRTDGRHDFSLVPPPCNMLDILQKNSKTTIGIGKIGDIFAHTYLDSDTSTTGNDDGINKLLNMQKQDFNGLCFVNLCDFDMKFGHRNDIDGYAATLSTFDKSVEKFIKKMADDDVLIITADHGCDPATESTDHSREYIPCLIYGKQITPGNFGTIEGFNHIGATVLKLLNATNTSPTLDSKLSIL